MIVAGGIAYPQFHITRSCHHGCPFSSFLFVLSLDSLAQTVRDYQFIFPITFTNTIHSSLYADNILLYVNKASFSMPRILIFHAVPCQVIK